MKKPLVLQAISILTILLAPAFAIAQATPTCKDMVTGIFYSYPKNTAERVVAVREGDYEKETSLVTGDSSIWKVKWLDDCKYSLQFESGNIKMTAEEKAFFLKHKVVFEIVKLSSTYYTYKGYIDKASGDPFSQDTIWLQEKTNITSNELFKQVKNAGVLKKAHFRDTSSYAVVYLYRPGKVSNSLANYPLYLNDNLLCVMKNNSGYIFKVMKEGPIELKSKLMKDQDAVTVNIEFGKSYYIKSMIHWTIHKGKNFKLIMEAEKPEDGVVEFGEVELQ